jgi:prolyl-tRNA editing enzyme YbaK/EbsC (Cys-tRNA(Pro) deacylase)
MTTGKQTLKLSPAEMAALIGTDRTVSVTFSGPEYGEVEALAEHRGVSIEEYLKTLVREERDAAIELARASTGKK